MKSALAPKNWEFVPLKNLGKYINGRAFKPSDWETGGLPIIRIQNLNDPSKTFNYYSKPVDNKFYVKNGDLLISWSASLGAYLWNQGDAILNQHIFRVEVNKKRVTKKFLFYAIRHALQDLFKETHGMGMKHVTKGKFEAFEVPIPNSLPEQDRIVARIETLFAELAEMRALHGKIVGDTGQLMDAVIQEMFNRPNNNWQTSLLSDNNIAIIQTGTALGRRFGDRETIELPYLRVANVQAGYLDLSEIKKIEIAIDEVERYRLQSDDLLLTEGGDYDKLGRGAVWENQIDPCIHQNHIFAVRFNQDVILPKFAEYEMQSWYAKSYFLRVAKKTTNLATINKTKLGNFPIRYPSLNEQKSLVEYFDAVNAEIIEMHKTQEDDASLLEHLEQSILAQAFRGEL
jgi:type I restriction enzyme, S subunit